MTDTFLIYGAYGYTGELITRYAAERGLKPILAGRNEAKVKELAGKYGFEHRAFALEDTAALDAALTGVGVCAPLRRAVFADLAGHVGGVP